MAVGVDGTMIGRRAVLQGAAGAAICCLAPSRQLTAAEPELAAVRGEVSVISGLGGNVVHYAGGASAIIVDSGAAEHADTLQRVLNDLPGGNVGALFNTHWHLDQVGGNAMLGRSGTRILAHEKTRAHLATPYYLPDEDRYQPALPPEAQPTESFFTSGSLGGGGRAIRYGYLLEAHTDGDIYVSFEEADVIAAGDAISPARDPELDWYGGGWLGGRIDALQLLLDISGSDTLFVPSYGPVVDRAYVEAEHALMLGLYEILWERVRAGESAEDIYRAGAIDTLSRRFDDPMKLLYDAHKSLWAHYNTLSPDIV